MMDPRMIEVLGALMGVDMAANTREEGSSDLPEGFKEAPRPASPPAYQPSPTPSSSRPTEPAPTPPKEEEAMEVDGEEVQAKKDALAAKAAGTEAYKKREFDEAIAQFEKAWDLYPKDITFLNNAGGL